MHWLLPRRRGSQDVNIVNLEFPLLEELIDGSTLLSEASGKPGTGQYGALHTIGNSHWVGMNRQLLVRDCQSPAVILGQDCSWWLFAAMAVEVQPRLFIPFAPLSVSPPCL